MMRYHSVPEIADAYMKGIRGYDAGQALDAMVASARYGAYGIWKSIFRLATCRSMSVRRARRRRWSTLRRLDHPRMARAMGRTDHRRTSLKTRSRNWRNVFDAKTGFVRPRLANENLWNRSIRRAPETAADSPRATSWQYSWYQPHDEGN